MVPLQLTQELFDETGGFKDIDLAFESSLGDLTAALNQLA